MPGKTGSVHGFGRMKLTNPEKQREIASKGGKEAQKRGTARKWTPEEAREAGRKGGLVSRKRGPNRVKRAKQSA